jgi:DNA-binding CsgD family transcriptional regulator/PAS domain-containing protein
VNGAALTELWYGPDADFGWQYTRYLFDEAGDAMPTTPTPPVTVAKLLRHHPYPLIITDLDTHVILGANDAAYKLLGRIPPSLDGAPVGEVVGKTDWPIVQASMSLLASGALEGYQAERLFLTGDGQELKVKVWVRVINGHGPRLALVAVEGDRAEVPWQPSGDRVTIAGIVTDHDWVIEMASSDVESILGLSPDDYIGRPLLGLLQPWDVQKFMTAVDRITGDGGGATLRAHLRDGEGRWRDVLLLMVAMDQHSPPRLGIAITDEDDNDEATADPHQQLAARSYDVLGGMDHFRLCSPPQRFSARQGEILTQVLRGERVQEIAKNLYLSPSTVRNHLTAIYRKFGVHSQAELLAKILRDPSSLDTNP